jgi:hypothetical protein
MGRLAEIIQHTLVFDTVRQRFGGKLDFMGPPRRHEGHGVFTQAAQIFLKIKL